MPRAAILVVSAILVGLIFILGTTHDNKGPASNDSTSWQTDKVNLPDPCETPNAVLPGDKGYCIGYNYIPS